MKPSILILLTLTALSLPGMAQDKDNQANTGGLRNGRGWLLFTDDMKVAYLTGYGNHWLATAPYSAKRPDFNPEEDFMPNLKVGGMVEGLDAFYAEPANLNITIRMALLILHHKVSGLSSTVLQHLTEMARKDALNSALTH